MAQHSIYTLTSANSALAGEQLDWLGGHVFLYEDFPMFTTTCRLQCNNFESKTLMLGKGSNNEPGTTSYARSLPQDKVLHSTRFSQLPATYESEKMQPLDSILTVLYTYLVPNHRGIVSAHTSMHD